MLSLQTVLQLMWSAWAPPPFFSRILNSALIHTAQDKTLLGKIVQSYLPRFEHPTTFSAEISQNIAFSCTFIKQDSSFNLYHITWELSNTYEIYLKCINLNSRNRMKSKVLVTICLLLFLLYKSQCPLLCNVRNIMLCFSSLYPYMIKVCINLHILSLVE